MASNSLLPLFVSLLFLTNLFVSSSFADNSEKVTLSLYYETLCPACADFIVNHLAQIFENGLISITNLRLVPWGNAQMLSNGSFICQHGPDECLLNTIDACAIDKYPNVSLHFAFVNCVERLALEQRHGDWKTCLQTPDIGTAPFDCYMAGKGYKIERKLYEETAQLNPPHHYVPWVVVNHQPLLEDFQNFTTYICKAYTGSHLPDACRSAALERSSSEKPNSLCYK